MQATGMSDSSRLKPPHSPAAPMASDDEYIAPRLGRLQPVHVCQVVDALA